ncbi:MAG: class I SAM-dependent methyltransferase [Candidatus Paceibacterota bacterium]|jgi:ubiquinone/menaquinone biosynthesis C-methylase UbiE
MDKKDTSWENVAVWYDSHLHSSDTYQEQVILPKLTELLMLAPDDTLLDLACGQGYFSHALLPFVGHVIGVDMSESLIDFARKATQIKDLERIEFHVSESHKLAMLADASVDKIIIVLALQNIRELETTLQECARVLRPSGSLHIVLNHPMFRIPKYSDWRYDTAKKAQVREVWRYYSEFSSSIIMNPGAKKDKQTTVSFHRPLASFIKAGAKAGFLLSNLEEWASNKESEPGPKAQLENIARKEIPLFMYLQLQKK